METAAELHAALTAADPGAVLLIAPGEYWGRFVVASDDIILCAADGDGRCGVSELPARLVGADPLGPGLAIEADGVHVSGLAITPHPDAEDQVAVHIEGQGVTLRDNTLHGAVHTTAAVDQVDARLNMWGVDGPRMTGHVLTTPFLGADRTIVPGLPVVHGGPAHHTPDSKATCAYDADGDGFSDLWWYRDACRYLSIQAAVDHAHANQIVVVPEHEPGLFSGSAPWQGTVTIAKNSLNETLAGLTLCSGPPDANLSRVINETSCTGSPEKAIIDGTGYQGSVLTISAPGVRVQDLTVRATTEVEDLWDRPDRPVTNDGMPDRGISVDANDTGLAHLIVAAPTGVLVHASANVTIDRVHVTATTGVHVDAEGMVENLYVTDSDFADVRGRALTLAYTVNDTYVHAAHNDWGAYTCDLIHGDDLLPGRIQDEGTQNTVDINPFKKEFPLDGQESCPIVRLTIDAPVQDLGHDADDNGATFNFTATAYDEHGATVPIDDAKEVGWSIDADGGSFDDNVLTPGTIVGDYVVSAEVTDAPEVRDETGFQITAGHLFQVPWIGSVDTTDADTNVTFVAVARDQHGNPTNDSVTYALVDGSSGDINNTTGEYTPRLIGVAHVTARSGDVMSEPFALTVLPGMATTIAWASSPNRTVADNQVTFVAEARDQHGNPTNDSVTYALVNGSSGTIDETTGDFTPELVGPATVEACVVLPGFEEPACISAEIEVLEGSLAELRVEATGPVEAGETLNLTVIGFDEKGNEFSVTNTAWSVEGDDCGTITEEGVYHAPARVLACTVTAENDGVSNNTTVQVVDTTPPVFVTVPQSLTVKAHDASGANVAFVVPRFLDLVDVNGTATCSPAPGSLFPVGQNSVTCTAQDAAGNAATITFQIRVTPPDAPPVPTDLAFDARPEQVTSGSPFAVTVDVLDEDGRRVSDSEVQVTLTLGSGPADGALGGTITRPAVAGIARFDDLTLDRVGNYTFRAEGPALNDVESDEIEVAPGPAHRAVFDHVPKRSVRDHEFEVGVYLVDAHDNLATTEEGELTLDVFAGPGSLTGNATQSVEVGVATFAGIALDQPGSYNLRVSAPDLESTTSATITVDEPPAASLKVISAPDGPIRSGDAFQVEVEVVDEDGQRIAGATNSVTLSRLSGPGEGTLGGERTRPAVGGVARFDNLTLDRVGAYALLARATGLGSDTTPVQVEPGAPAGMKFVFLPNRLSTDQEFTAVVHVLDSNRNLVTDLDAGAVRLDLVAGPDDGVLLGDSEADLQGGVARFNTLNLDTDGEYTLRATLNGLDALTHESATITVSPGAPATLTFEQIPQRVTSGETFTVRVQVLDGGGNLVTDAREPVTLGRATGPINGALDGTLVRTPVDGVVEFTDLRVKKAGSYSLLATGPGIVSPSSPAVQVEPGGADRVVFASVTSPSATFTAMVRIEDEFGNRVRDGRVPVALTLHKGPGGGSLTGTNTLSTRDGLGIFEGLAFSQPGNYRLQASSPDLESAVSRAVQQNPPLDEVVALRLETIDNLTVAAGGVVRFNVTALDADGTPIESPFAVTYRLSSPGFGTIGTDGVFKAMKVGAVKLEATLGNISAPPLTIKVQPGVLTSLRITPETAVVPVDQAVDFIAEGRDAFGNRVAINNVSWSGSETNLPSREPFRFTGSQEHGVERIQARAQGLEANATVVVTGLEVFSGEHADLDAAVRTAQRGDTTVGTQSTGVGFAEAGSRFSMDTAFAGGLGAGSVDVTIGQDAYRLGVNLETRPGSLDTPPEGLDAADLAAHMDTLATGADPGLFLRVSASEGGQEVSSGRLNEVLDQMNLTFRLSVDYFEESQLDKDRVRLVEYSDGVRAPNAVAAQRISEAPVDGFHEYRVNLVSFSSFAVIAFASETTENASDGDSVSTGSNGGGAGGAAGGGGGGGVPSASSVYNIPVFRDAVVKQARLELDEPMYLSRLAIRSSLPGDAPEGVPALPTGLDLQRWLVVDTGVSTAVTGQLTVILSLPANEIQDPEHGLLLHLVDGEWVPESALTLQTEGDRLVGTVSTPCCSIYAVVFDMEPPGVTLEAPEGQQDGEVLLRATANDNVGVLEVVFAVDGETLTVLSEAPYEVLLDTTQYTNGEHTLTVSATDLAGRSATDSRVLLVENEPEEQQGTDVEAQGATEANAGWPVILLISVALIAAAGAAVFVYRKKDRAD